MILFSIRDDIDVCKITSALAWGADMCHNVMWGNCASTKALFTVCQADVRRALAGIVLLGRAKKKKEEVRGHSNHVGHLCACFSVSAGLNNIKNNPALATADAFPAVPTHGSLTFYLVKAVPFCHLLLHRQERIHIVKSPPFQCFKLDRSTVIITALEAGCSHSISTWVITMTNNWSCLTLLGAYYNRLFS